jgi:hypothetical protein
MFDKKRKAQVWIETVIYTLIGIVVIGLLLAFAKPKIDSIKDKSIIEQSISSFNELNKLIYEVQARGPENSRQIDLKISKGRLVIYQVNATTNRISWIVDPVEYKYSQPGISVSSGDLKLRTESKTEKGKTYLIEIFKEYPLKITFNEEEIKKEIANSPSPYKLIIKNNGVESITGTQKIDISM